MKTIYCCRLKKSAESMASAPFPGPLGERILQNVSQVAWGMWLERQTILINEYRLNLMDIKAKEFLTQEMENYFFL